MMSNSLDPRRLPLELKLQNLKEKLIGLPNNAGLRVDASWTANNPLARLKLETVRNKARIKLHVDIRVHEPLLRDGLRPVTY